MNEAVVLSDEFCDAYYDTIPGRCCDCPSCNYYAPDYEEHMGKPCVTDEMIRAEIARQLAEQREQIAQAIETAGAIRDLNADWRDGMDEAARIARGGVA